MVVVGLTLQNRAHSFDDEIHAVPTIPVSANEIPWQKDDVFQDQDMLDFRTDNLAVNWNAEKSALCAMLGDN